MSRFSDTKSDRKAVTPFYRTLADPSNPYPEVNYESYDIFGLNIILTYWIRQKWKSCNAHLEFPTVRGKGSRENSLFISVVPTIGGEKYEMTDMQLEQLQGKINEITSKPIREILVLSYESLMIRDEFGNSIMIPSGWIRSICPYLGISSKIKSRISDDGILIDLRDHFDYNNIYNKVSLEIISLIKKMYLEGYVVNPSRILIDNWGLINSTSTLSTSTLSTRNEKSYDNNEWVFGVNDMKEDGLLFHPGWKDARITSCYGGIQGFFNHIERGSDKIKIPVGNKLLSKHNVATYMLDQKIPFEFSDSNVSVQINNIVDAQSVASIIDIDSNKGYGRIVEMKSDRLSWNILYMEIARRMRYEKGVTYLTDDPERPYVFSLLIPMEENDEFLMKTLFETSRDIMTKLEREYTADIVDSFSFITPHDYIEKNISSVPMILEKAMY